ncbi:MAG TPA: DMT family transporter [Mycobacteriales bacterium]|nr:DMT family transporter [Mycobacteriales bacterium]
MVAAGALLGVQARVNGALGVGMHSALLASLVSFAGGTALLAVIVTARAGSRAGLARLRSGPTRWYYWLGGLAGGLVVASSAAGAPRIGVSLVSVCLVAGTTAGALLVDRVGLGPGGHQPVTRRRLAGAALAVAAVGLGAIGRPARAGQPLLFIAIVAAGFASAGQQAVNGQLRRVADDVAVAALISFAVGLAGLAAVAVAAAAAGALPRPSWPGTWWFYTGGLYGAVYIAAAAAAVRRLGVLRISLATVGGQLAGSVLLDLVFPEPRAPLTAVAGVGVVLTLIAVAVASTRRAVAV